MKLISRRKFSENNVFDFYYEHLIDDASNEVRDYFVLEPKAGRKDGVSGVAVLPILDKSVGLISIYRPAARANSLEIPHGFIDAGEDDLTAARRELKEETGLNCDVSDMESLGFFQPDIGINGTTVHLFSANVLASDYMQSQISELGLGEFKFVAFWEVRQMVATGIILDSFTLTALFKYFEKKGAVTW
jgi:8-oxo-dGTP pyrophosphatase MutT (NUDIX family)